MLKNTYYNTNPVVLHSPSPNPLWDDLQQKIYSMPFQQTYCDNLTVITWNNHDFLSPLEYSLNLWGINHQVLGKGIKYWQNKKKINLTYDALKNIKTKYVMGIDAYDAMLCGNINYAINEFEFSKCKILFNSSCVNAYNVLNTTLLCEKHYKDYPNKYFNAGCWIGQTDFCRYFFEKARTVRDKMFLRYKNSEQIRLSKVFNQTFPSSQLDVKCTIFQLIEPLDIFGNQGFSYLKNVFI